MRKHKRTAISFSLTLLCCMLIHCPADPAFAQPSSSEHVFLAGAAKGDITPPLGGIIIGDWTPTEAQFIHDPLQVRCLVIESRETRIVFAVCDNLGLPQEVCDAAKQLIYTQTGIPPDHVMIASTHTHSAVRARGENSLIYYDTFDAYQQFIISRIADTVRTAIHNLEPARIGWGSAQEPTSVFNRRWYLDSEQPPPNPFGGTDQVVMNPSRGSENLIKPAGPTDPQVAFLSVQSADGRPIALLANYSLHYVGGVERGAVSADYFAVFADRIQERLQADRLDPPFVGIMSNGTSGDINNINFIQSYQPMPPYQKMKEVAYTVADAVYAAHQQIRFHDTVKLGAKQTLLPLKVRKPTAEEVQYAKNILAKPEDAQPFHRHERIYADRVLMMHQSPDRIEVILQAFRIGDTAITTIPFEVLVEIGLELKAKNPFEHSFTLSLANGSFGYLPTQEQHQLGGYETWLGTNKVQKNAANLIIGALLDLVQQLHQE